RATASDHAQARRRNVELLAVTAAMGAVQFTLAFGQLNQVTGGDRLQVGRLTMRTWDDKNDILYVMVEGHARSGSEVSINRESPPPAAKDSRSDAPHSYVSNGVSPYKHTRSREVRWALRRPEPSRADRGRISAPHPHRRPR